MQIYRVVPDMKRGNREICIKQIITIIVIIVI